MQQMASDIFVRILRGMGACGKKPAQPASGTLSWMTPSETLLRLCLGGFGDMKWAWGGGWRLPAFLCQTTSSPDFTGPFSRPKNPSKTCALQGASPEGSGRRSRSRKTNRDQQKQNEVQTSECCCLLHLLQAGSWHRIRC